ncbi:MAG: argininosuccinate lyase [Candidatus Sumerlaeaceae bacterium]
MNRPKTKPTPQVWGERMSESPDVAAVQYCAGRDVAPRPMADAVLVPYDLWQNRSHVAMLARQGIIAHEEAARIFQALDDFEKRWTAGKLALDPQKEDVHINIEHFVAATVGAQVAGKMHTARSRNDQSATVVRMYIREQLLSFGEQILAAVEAILAQARRHVRTLVAGLTHYQPASITTIGHWFASYAEALLRDAARVVKSFDTINISPLGAAAAFGTSWPIDRTFTADLLGFDAVQENSLDCITNRWEMEAEAATCVAFGMTHLSIVAQDLILLSQPHFGIVRLADRHTTGSSIMPQKRNPDFAEVTRAKAVLVQQLLATLLGIARGLVSGYNRDTQWTKYVIMDIFEEASPAPAIFRSVFAALSVDKERALATASSHFVDAVDFADSLARDVGLPFRTAYKIVSRAVRQCEILGHLETETVKRLAAEESSESQNVAFHLSPREIVERKKHLGAPAPEAVLTNIEKMQEKRKLLLKELGDRRRKLNRARQQLAKMIERVIRNASPRS